MADLSLTLFVGVYLYRQISVDQGYWLTVKVTESHVHTHNVYTPQLANTICATKKLKI